MLAIAVFSSVFAKAKEVKAEVYPVRVYLFHSEGCPHCRDEMEFLQALKKEFVNLELHDFEVSRDMKNQSLFRNLIKQEGLTGAVPVTVIGENVLVGFDNEKGVGVEIENLVRECSWEKCENPLDNVLGLGGIKEEDKICLEESVLGKINSEKDADCSNVDQDERKREGSVSLWGKNFSLGERSLLGLGILLGLADGINPCMFSVLIFLMTYLLAVGSRRRAMKAGVAFVVTTFLLYFSVMAGAIKFIDVLEISGQVRLLVIGLALVAGMIMIKDFFFYGRWFSLEISDRFKPTIEKLIKKGTLPSAIILALFSGLVELPCTSGLPLAYITVLTEREVEFFWPLVWYNLFFVMPAFLIVLAVFFAWVKVDQVEEKRAIFKKYMRLVAGILLILLAVALWRNWL